ncbi:MAG TPA: ATP-binding protein [Syntrophorhabdaceae bacterium]|nr:ATP-binding protein [Syntrophorhabdaceae bacterium]
MEQKAAETGAQNAPDSSTEYHRANKRQAIFLALKRVFRSLSLKTQMLLILVFLLLMSISSLTVLYSRSEEQLIDKVTDNIDDITKAIQISVEELTYRGDSTERLKSYVNMLNKKGIKEISILNDTSEVIASSNPQKVGTKETIGEKKTGRKKGLMITARLGDDHLTDTQKLYNVIMPVSIKGQNIGYIHINMALDDYQLLRRQGHIKRILSMVFAFSIGIIICLIIAEKYTDPIKKIANASKKIAEGELVKIREKERGDEIGVLITSFNEMVDKLVERMELEEKLKKTEQLSMIGQLSSGIAHEIRNPLNFLSLSIGHIKESIGGAPIENREDLLALLDNLLKEIQRVNELIHNFLFLGKPITLNRERISSQSLVNEALSLVRHKIPDTIKIATACREGEDSMFCDREYTRICLINLIVNAVQSIRDEGEVRIECGRENTSSYVSVTDTGEGIGPDEIQKIFEPYYSTKKFGIGIGLAITKRFVEEQGGSITIASHVGRGTTMTMRIPYEA